MGDSLVNDIVLHIVNVYNRLNENKLEYGEVLNKFEHLLSNETLCSLNEGTLNRLYSRMIEDEEVVSFAKNALFGVLNEGFYNPFSDDYHELGNTDFISDIKVADGVVIKDRDNCPIKRIKKWDTNVNGKIVFRGDKKVYSGVNFLEGDIVEECPVKELRGDAMFSRDIRDLAFQLYPDKEIYGIPFGYVNYYATAYDVKDIPNVDYGYDPKEGIIRVVAIRNIKKGDLLVLRVSEDFMK